MLTLSSNPVLQQLRGELPLSAEEMIRAQDLQTLHDASAMGVAELQDLVRGWFRPIWQRLRNLASLNVNRVALEEAERVLKETGKLMTDSDRVRAALYALDLAEVAGIGIGYLHPWTSEFDARIPDELKAVRAAADTPSAVALLSLFGYAL